MKHSLKASLVALILGLAAGRLLSSALAEPAAQPKVDFSKDIQPIFKQSCVKCHGFNPKKPNGGKGAAELRLDDKALAMKGGRSGPAIVPGDAKNSLLFKVLHGSVPRPVKGEEEKDIPPMPLAKKGQKWKPLPDAQVALIGQWIDQGADWPETKK